MVWAIKGKDYQTGYRNQTQLYAAYKKHTLNIKVQRGSIYKDKER